VLVPVFVPVFPVFPVLEEPSLEESPNRYLPPANIPTT